MSVLWDNVKCASCNVDNYYYIGDVEDVAVPDIEGTECYSCGQREITEGCYDPEYVDYVLGRKNPMEK